MKQPQTLTKAQLLTLLESTPQRYWPPRPTHQSKATLVDAIERARITIGYNEGERFRAALTALDIPHNNIYEEAHRLSQ